MEPPPATGLAALGIFDAAIHAFVVSLQGLVAAGLQATFPSLYLSVPMGKVTPLSLLHLYFVCGVKGYGDLPTIWEAVAIEKVRMEGLATLN